MGWTKAEADREFEKIKAQSAQDAEDYKYKLLRLIEAMGKRDACKTLRLKWIREDLDGVIQSGSLSIENRETFSVTKKGRAVQDSEK